jgi:hypothetical protein
MNRIVEITPTEQKAISALKEVARKWPENLWLFSANGSLHVMRKDSNGKHAYSDHEKGGVDPSYSLDTINIDNDGGDW